MANKENLPPQVEAHRYLGDDRSTPPGNISGSLGIRNWQHSAFNYSPPFSLLSPNSKPSLARQRDHSACRRADSPLKVRKTRENLKQASIYADVPPPCVHSPGVEDECCVQRAAIGGATAHRPLPSNVSRTDEQSDISGTTVAPSSADSGMTSPLNQTKILRHKSVSRRMLSKVKEGIAYRSRSSHSIRATESDTRLMRRLSGKRKQSSEEQSRLRSFEVSRESIDSQDVDASTSQRSFTDSSISTDELMGSAALMSPPSVRSDSRMTPDRNFSGPLLSPTPTPHSPTADLTPRPPVRHMSLSLNREIPVLQATVPYVDLNVLVDRDSIDVGISQDVWVSIEATVRSKIAGAHIEPSSRTTPIRRRPMDAIIFLSPDIFAATGSIAQKCILELCTRLDFPGDRLAVLFARQHQVDGTTFSCNCCELHPLQPPATAMLLERLGVAPPTLGGQVDEPAFEARWQPLQHALKTVNDQGLRKDAVQAFVISKSPNVLVQALVDMVRWPAHAFKLGLESCSTSPTAPLARNSWAFEFKADADITADLLDNMFRDIRHGCSMGTIPSMRLCFKPMERSRIVEVVGQKAVKDLKLGQRCALFLEIHIPKRDTSQPSNQQDVDQDSLFAELESIVGTLETDFLHVEARYRHSALPTENVVTLRHICSIRRPKTDSRWSIIGSASESTSASQVHAKLAQFVATHYPPTRALKMLDRWSLQQSASSEAVQQVYKYLQGQANFNMLSDDGQKASAFDKPAVIITDSDTEARANQHFTTVPCTPVSDIPPDAASVLTSPAKQDSKLPNSSSTSTILLHRTLSAPKTTTAITIPAETPTEHVSSDAQDTARQLWRHIRRSSLSAKQIMEMSPEKLQQLEASDETLKELRHKALLNKRSIGAETLKAWRWEEKTNAGGEAPWL